MKATKELRVQKLELRRLTAEPQQIAALQMVFELESSLAMTRYWGSGKKWDFEILVLGNLSKKMPLYRKH